MRRLVVILSLFAAAPALGQMATPFVVTAPVFKGWLADPLVARLAGGARLEPALLSDALRRDNTGDTAIAALNAAVLVGRHTPAQTAEIVWQAVALHHPDSGELGAAPLPLAQLTPEEATVLGYAQALRNPRPVAPANAADARSLAASVLFAAATGKLPSAATLGPLMALGHTIDVQRQPDPCRPIGLEDALRGVVLRANLPQAARQPLVQALDTLLRQCQAARPQRPPP